MENGTTGEKIKNAAIREFAQYGFEGSRVDRIAKRARINKAMIYYHYRSKENLYESILTGMYRTAYERLAGRVEKDQDPYRQFENLIGEFIGFIRDLDQDLVRMMMRELASGGKYFKKLMIPNVIVPMMGIVGELFATGIRQGTFKKVMPHYTFIQIAGSIIFANALRLVLGDTDLGKSLFGDDFFEGFKNNLLATVGTGILAR